VLLAVLLGFCLWQTLAEQSLTNDEPFHLLAGAQMHQHGTNTINLEHPPLVKWLAVLPLTDDPALQAPPLRAREARQRWQQIFTTPDETRGRFVSARLVLVACFVVPLLVVCFVLGRQVRGPWAGGLLVVLMGFSFSTLPYLGLAQTDGAVTLGFTAAVAAGIAFARAPGRWQAVALGLGLGLAMAAKFSGVLLAPTVMLALVLGSRKSPLRRQLGWVGLTLVTAAAVLLGTLSLANLHYDPELGRQAIVDVVRNQSTVVVEEELQSWEEPLLALSGYSPGLAQYFTGLLAVRSQNAIGIYPSFAFGELTSRGRWWYFPVLLAVKTPLVILLALMAGVFFGLRRLVHGNEEGGFGKMLRPAFLLPAVTVVVYLGMAMVSNYNLGVRHLLPVMPLLFLPAAAWAAERRSRTLLLAAAVVAESLVVAPLWMASTNTWWLGAANPTRFELSASNLEYKQNFRILAREIEERGLEPVAVYYPGASERELHAYLPTARLDRPSQPLQPGWYAVGIHAEQILPAVYETTPETFYGYENYHRIAASWYPRLRRIESGEAHGVLAGTFHLYRLTEEVLKEKALPSRSETPATR
jgi:4-amino-4-deoxy-L-arabinose transferase-like glycosyltransferase